MPSRGYARGDNAVAICDRCAEKIKYKDLMQDGQYPHMRVCSDCWDPKHPQEYLADTFDPVTLWDPTGDPERMVANAAEIDFVPFPADGVPTNNISGDQYGAGKGQDIDSTGYYQPLQIGIGVNGSYHNAVNGIVSGD